MKKEDRPSDKSREIRKLLTECEVDTLQSSAGLVSERKMFNMFRPLKPGHVYSTMGPDFVFEVSAIHTFQNTKALRH